MRSFTIRWRSARRHREFEYRADGSVGPALMEAISASGGLEIWQENTLWRCPGCGDRTLGTEEFLESLRLAEDYLVTALSVSNGEPARQAAARSAADWIAAVTLLMFACERDRVYIKDESGECAFAAQTYLSRI